MFRTTFVFLASFFTAMTVMAQSVVINEVMSSNSQSAVETEGEFPDWIELYNAGTAAVNLNGFGLSDKREQPFLCVLPDVTIPAKGTLLVIADEKTGTLVHANFKISASGETVYLTRPDGTWQDSIALGALPSNVSYGRYPDGGGKWYYYRTASPAAPNTDQGLASLVTETPEFSVKGGMYASSVTVTLSTAAANASIFYTLNGAEPTASSPAYTAPIRIDTTTVLRARIRKDGVFSGTIATQTYIIGKQTALLVISLSTDPVNLWDSTRGIYVNWDKDIEVPVHLEIFEPRGTNTLGMDAGMQIFGGWSAQFPQKSFAVFARAQYGPSSVDYRLFPNLPYDKYKSFVLRNSGTDYWNTHFRDGFMQSLISGLDIETQAYRPAVVYLNGAYWGILNVREKINEHYIESHFGVKEDELDMLENDYNVLHGDDAHYMALLDYIGKNDMSLDASYEYVKTQMDISNYLNYETSEIYFANTDWPGWNVRYWRPRTPEGKWRWIVFDLDGGFGLGNPWEHGYSTMLDMVTDPLGTDWPNPAWSTFLLRKLLENKRFRQDLVNRFADHMNTIWRPAVVSKRIDEMAAELEQEIQLHLARFGRSYDVWKWDVKDLKIFGDHRVDTLRLDLLSKFALPGLSTVTLRNASPASGAIRVNNMVLVSDSVWSGIYFKDVPIGLTAVPNPGYRFVKWTGGVSGTAASVTVPLSGDVSATAVFEAIVADAGGMSEDRAPKEFALGQNYPNPFNPETQITYQLPKAGMVTLAVYDVLGKEAAVLVNEQQNAGTYSCRFSSVDLRLPSGVYFYRLWSGDFSAIKRMVVIK